MDVILGTLVGAIGAAALFFIFFLISRVDATDEETMAFLAVVTAVPGWIVFAVAYEVGLTAKWGQTLGKRIVGIRVVHEAHGGMPGWGKSFGRWAIPALAGAVTFGLGGLLCYLSATWSKVRQGWHDLAAGTVVTRTHGVKG